MKSGDFTPVYENQKNDVHPPLFYLFLRIAMEFMGTNFSKWTGIVLNIIIYVFVTVFMYMILQRLLSGEKKANIKASILSFMSSIILASLSNAVYIRMYALLTLEILITIYLHIKLLEQEKINAKLLLAIGFIVLAGILTHYYYLFFVVFLYLVFFIKYIKEKEVKSVVFYTLTMFISGILSLIIFPYSIQHMFFGYRGQGVISNFENISEIAEHFFSHLYNLNYYGFNNLLIVIAVMIIGILIYNRMFKRDVVKFSKDKKDILRIIYIPTLCFFIMSAIASPWRVLRYIVPVCGVIFVLAIYYLYELLKTVSKERVCNILIMILFGAILISPFVFKMKPELLYTEKKEIVEGLSENSNLKAIYIFNSQKSNFIDDILLFSIIDESYIARDIEYTEESIGNIIGDKDVSNGLVVFISEDENYDEILNVVKNATGLNDSKFLGKLNTCQVFVCK